MHAPKAAAHDPRAIANEFLLQAQLYRQQTGKNYYLRTLQLSKMVVIANGLHLISFSLPLCRGNLVNAPETGFSVHYPILRKALLAYGDGPVQQLIRSDNSLRDMLGTNSHQKPIKSDLQKNEVKTINRLWQLQTEHNLTCHQWSYFIKDIHEIGEISNASLRDALESFLQNTSKSYRVAQAVA